MGERTRLYKRRDWGGEEMNKKMRKYILNEIIIGALGGGFLGGLFFLALFGA